VAALSGALLFAAAGALSGTVGTIFQWGCGTTQNWGQCQWPDTGATAIAAGASQSLALKNDGTVVAWGCLAHDFGQCSVPTGLRGVTAIDAGYAHSLALKSDGTVVAWGCGAPNNFGQCSVPFGLAGVTAIAAGTSHSLALKNDGTVVAWGCSGGDYGQCTVPNGLSGVVAIAARRRPQPCPEERRHRRRLGLRRPVQLRPVQRPERPQWSDRNLRRHVAQPRVEGGRHRRRLGLQGDDYGQCTVPGGLAGVTAIAAGDVHNLALKRDGTVVAWGCGAPYNFDQCVVPNTLADIGSIAAGDAQSLARRKTGQSITFGQLAPGTYGDPDFTVSAVASSGLPVSFAASGKCTVNGQTVHVSGAGSCTITASQPGDATDWSPARDLSRPLLVRKANQTITFEEVNNRTYGDPDFTVLSSASSALPVSLTATGNCTLNGTTTHITGAGYCTIAASQPGDADYNAAVANRSMTIAKANQTITFLSLPQRTYGDHDFNVSAAASTNLPVSFAARGRCIMRGRTIHLTSAGVCTITASQPGDSNYNAAPDVSRSFAIARPSCAPPKVVGKTLAAARGMIARKHCRTGRVTHASSSTRKAGTVISQSRRPGKALPNNSKINLVVSRGRR